MQHIGTAVEISVLPVLLIVLARRTLISVAVQLCCMVLMNGMLVQRLRQLGMSLLAYSAGPSYQVCLHMLFTYIHKVNIRQAKRQQEIYFCCSTALFHAAVVLVECSVYDICPSCWTWIHSTSCTCTDDRLACIMPHSMHCTAQRSTTLLYTLYCSISQSSSLGDNTSLLVKCHLASSLATACLINHHAQTARSLQQSGKTNEYMLEHIWASR